MYEQTLERLVMATPGQLVKAISEVLGIPEATVTEVDRNLAANDLRTVKGRGRGAAKSTARDAACNLTALLSIGFPGSLSVKASADLVRQYAATLPHKSTSGKMTGNGYFDTIGVEPLSQLPEAHSFIDAFEALIAAAGAGNIEGFQIGVAVKGPLPMAGIYISGSEKGSSADIKYGIPNPYDRYQTRHPPEDEVLRWQSRIAAFRTDTDIVQVREITQKTIAFVGKLIAA